MEPIPLALPARRSSSLEGDAQPPLAAIGAQRSSSFEVDAPRPLPARRSNTFEVHALRPLAAIEDQGRMKSSVVALQAKRTSSFPFD